MFSKILSLIGYKILNYTWLDFFKIQDNFKKVIYSRVMFEMRNLFRILKVTRPKY